MRILLVEDDSRLAAVLRKGLKEQGFGLDVCGDATSGQKLALANDYDAVLLDVMLPGGSGLNLLRELRKRGRGVPVLILTARSSVEERVKGLDLGADDYLPKPFDFQELLARIRAITRRPPIVPRTQLSIADLVLDAARHEVKRSGKRIELTAKEFALLEYLLRNKGVVVTRGMILDHVWDLDYPGGSNLVDVYINYLRRKVDHPDFEPRLIHTIRGVGYVVREAE
jgi:DNA-binding response OmpR family regulator